MRCRKRVQGTVLAVTHACHDLFGQFMCFGQLIDDFQVIAADLEQRFFECLVKALGLFGLATHRSDDVTELGKVFRSDLHPAVKQCRRVEQDSGFGVGSRTDIEGSLAAAFLSLIDQFPIAVHENVLKEHHMGGHADRVVRVLPPHDVGQETDVFQRYLVVENSGLGPAVVTREDLVDRQQRERAVVGRNVGSEQEPVEHGLGHISSTQVVGCSDTGVEFGLFELSPLLEDTFVEDPEQSPEHHIVGVEQFINKGEVGIDKCSGRIVKDAPLLELFRVDGAEEFVGQSAFRHLRVEHARPTDSTEDQAGTQGLGRTRRTEDEQVLASQQGIDGLDEQFFEADQFAFQ